MRVTHKTQCSTVRCIKTNLLFAAVQITHAESHIDHASKNIHSNKHILGPFLFGVNRCKSSWFHTYSAFGVHTEILLITAWLRWVWVWGERGGGTCSYLWSNVILAPWSWAITTGWHSVLKSWLQICPWGVCHRAWLTRIDWWNKNHTSFTLLHHPQQSVAIVTNHHISNMDWSPQ